MTSVNKFILIKKRKTYAVFPQKVHEKETTKSKH